MSVSPLTTVLGQLGLTQVRYVSPVRRGAARGLVGRVYAQVEQEFGVLAPSVALHSPAPAVLAASWLMLREVLLVTSDVDRTAKEAVATTVSLGNTCPWCSTVHGSTFSRLTGEDAQSITAPGLRAVATWAKNNLTRAGALLNEPACSARQAPELVGTAILLHYYNRMVNVFLTELPLPPMVPSVALGPVLRVLDSRIRPAPGQSYPPGRSLELLPAATVPGDLSWATGNPVLADAFARICAAVDAAGTRSVPEPVRDMVTRELENWDGEPRGPGRSWVEQVLAASALPVAHRPAGRLALLTAISSYQVDRRVIDELRSDETGDAALVELTAWASLAAARRIGAWIPVAP